MFFKLASTDIIDTLFELVPELSVLKTKLPAEIHSGDGSFFDASSDKIADLRREVQALLMAKLLHNGEGQ